MRNWQISLLFFLALLFTWELLFRLGLWPAYVFPSPTSVAAALVKGFASGQYILAIATSLRRIAIGYGLSIVAGVPLGLLLGRSRLMQASLGSLVVGLQALPSICWLPLALLWFGLGETAILFVVVMGALLAITISTADGVRNTPPVYLRAARTMGARGMRLYARVVLPSAFPSIISGMKLGWSFAWRSLMAGELLFITLGLGQALAMGRELNNMSAVIAVMLIIIAIGLGVDRLFFAPVERRIRERWGLQAAAR
ncbi:MAG: ABC transporter permease [Anaerolineales bacterium]|nr:ABC transporter permease [Anaerolineales bacterium]